MVNPRGTVVGRKEGYTMCVGFPDLLNHSLDASEKSVDYCAVEFLN